MPLMTLSLIGRCSTSGKALLMVENSRETGRQYWAVGVAVGFLMSSTRREGKKLPLHVE